MTDEHMMTDDEHIWRAEDDIDFDRVIIDPSYRRRVIEQLRAQAAQPTERSPAHSGRDD